MFTASDYAKIHSLVFSSDYPGYTPEVVESPNGDGVLDVEKRYAHIASKYLERDREPDRRRPLVEYLGKAHDLAVQVAVTLGIPPRYWPDYHQGCLRVLEYSPTATTAPHTDFNLFTLMVYRNKADCFKYMPSDKLDASLGHATYFANYKLSEKSKQLSKKARELNFQLHLGELLEEIQPDCYLADKHQVVASGDQHQYSIVYFAVPPENAVLSSGKTVGKWLEERKARSRVVQSLDGKDY